MDGMEDATGFKLILNFAVSLFARFLCDEDF
jgi:hypothetical protein